MRKNRLNLSQRAHERLARKNKLLMSKDFKNYDKYFIKSSYHARCQHVQAQQRKILSRSERERIYDDVIKTFY